MSARFVGRTPQVIAEAAGISITDRTKVLIGEQDGVGDGNSLSYEKLTRVLGSYNVKDKYETSRLCFDLLQNGIGHTLSLHTEDSNIVMEFPSNPSSRILINTGTHGEVPASPPVFSLHLGLAAAPGAEAPFREMLVQHIINVKKVAYGIVDLA